MNKLLATQLPKGHKRTLALGATPNTSPARGLVFEVVPEADDFGRVKSPRPQTPSPVKDSARRDPASVGTDRTMIDHGSEPPSGVVSATVSTDVSQQQPTVLDSENSDSDSEIEEDCGSEDSE